MSFATTTALQVKMIGTTFDTATSALASACIVDAQSEITKRLAKRYDFAAAPFNGSASLYPPMIVSLTETLAIGYMYENMARGSKETYQRADRYIKKVMDNLEALAGGVAQLVGVDGVPVDEISGDWTVLSTDNYPQTFNEDDPKQWRVSRNKLEDIKDEREDG